MEGSDTIYTWSSSSSNPPQSVVISPCAACKILRRRCVDNCVLAPYFPPHDPLKFTTAHRVFGASNIIKFLQELPEAQRDDAVSSMVYEANARLRDPVYGCAGAIYQLQKQINELQEQLAKAQAEIVNMQCQHSNLMALSPIQSGCCKPPTSCGYVFMNETYWAPREGLVGTDPDCLRWNYNDQGQLCYDCDSCKAGVLASLKKSWRKVSVINIAILIILVIVYCMAFRHNNRIDNDEPYGETRMEKSQPSRIHF